MSMRGLLLLAGISSAPALLASTNQSCFQDAEISFAGFSEMRHMVQPVEAELHCKVYKAANLSHTLLGHQAVCSGWNNLRHRYTKLAHGYGPLRDSYCREALYSEKPYQAHCARPSHPSFVISYEWKSFAYAERDVIHKKRVLEAARR